MDGSTTSNQSEGILFSLPAHPAEPRLPHITRPARDARKPDYAGFARVARRVHGSRGSTSHHSSFPLRAGSMVSATEARSCELQRPQCSRRMRCSSGSCTEAVHVRDITAQSSARASTMHTYNAPRIAGLILIDQAEPTLARVPWRHVERARVRTPAEGETPSPEHTLHAHPRCREAASSGVRELATPGASMAASGRSSLARSIARRPRHECFLAHSLGRRPSVGRRYAFILA